jgi:hypothetical protein
VIISLQIARVRLQKYIIFIAQRIFNIIPQLKLTFSALKYYNYIKHGSWCWGICTSVYLSRFFSALDYIVPINNINSSTLRHEFVFQYTCAWCLMKQTKWIIEIGMAFVIFHTHIFTLTHWYIICFSDISECVLCVCEWVNELTNRVCVAAAESEIWIDLFHAGVLRVYFELYNAQHTLTLTARLICWTKLASILLASVQHTQQSGMKSRQNITRFYIWQARGWYSFIWRLDADIFKTPLSGTAIQKKPAQ